MWDEGLKVFTSGKIYLGGTLEEKNGEILLVSLVDTKWRRKSRRIYNNNICWTLTVCQSCTLILSLICETLLQGSNFHLFFLSLFYKG